MPQSFDAGVTLGPQCARGGAMQGIQSPETCVPRGHFAAPTVELAKGTRIKDRFEICDELGRGGMGLVYKARDLRKVEAHDPDPFVAIKILAGDMATFDLGFVALQRECKHAQALNHPNIVKVFDFDRDGELVFLTMELLRGESLQARLRNLARPLGNEERLKIARGLMAGLGYAHGRGIVHADMKPSNVFLCEDGEAKILDFGIARAGERDAVFDADDVGAMTMDYASIEMLAGERPTPADDVFALGCMLYFVHVGRHPFDHRPADEACRSSIHPMLPRTLPRVQARAIGKALSFRRNDRFADALAMARAFDAFDARRWVINGSIALAVFGVGAWLAFDPVQGAWHTWQLSASDHVRIKEAIAEGRGNLERRYWEDAAVRFVDALRLDPRNGEARSGLAEVVSDMRNTMPPEDVPVAMSILRERTGCLNDEPSCPAWVQNMFSLSER